MKKEEYDNDKAEQIICIVLLLFVSLVSILISLS